ncbi:hypothetical protein [Streptomyces sp. NPDC056160]|uniref:hypothetical protein n=1 Tax=Streptomyces sp. NPDC056160 TaxID=3345731 RepID=UPI0035D59EC4
MPLHPEIEACGPGALDVGDGNRATTAPAERPPIVRGAGDDERVAATDAYGARG